MASISISGIVVAQLHFLCHVGWAIQWEFPPPADSRMAANHGRGNLTAAMLAVSQDMVAKKKKQQISEGYLHFSALYSGLLERMVMFDAMLITLLILVFFCTCLWISPKARDCFEMSMDSGSAALIGKPPPDFVMTLLDRTDKRIADLLSMKKPMVLRFYASRGRNFYSTNVRDVEKECTSEVKALDELAQDIKYYTKVVFVLVAVDHPGTTDLEAYNSKLNISDKCVHGELKRGWDASLRGYCVDNLPHTTIVGSNGIVAKNFDAFGAYLVDVRQCIDDLLQGKNPKPEVKTTPSRHPRH